ncbi:MAG TPA: serine/threonine-protein kinase [Thermoanaerobaculia bacterium]|nr:serine/threonine-protein kinase [Thermoanaerobaculia bacterium]
MKLGRYEVVRELGKGAMGIVYLAKDPLIGRLVALKTIRAVAHADDDETKEFQQRFIREAQAAGILNHPAIVTVHDIGQDDTSGVSFIAMEYVEGNNLKEVMAQGRALSFDQIADIVAQVAEALDFAHSKGIVHRDVKPANIILIEGYRAKITDFGIAKIASGVSNLTTTGQFLGTPNYMAPEQIKGAPVDGRTDIFSLGICLYECLTRRKPFGGDSLTSISYKIVHEPFPPLHEINPQIPEGFADVVANCLAKDPAKRYQRARDMAAALRAVARGERPVRPLDPMLAEETIVTRTDKATVAATPTPTLEVPFPQAVDAVQGEAGTRPVSGKPAAAAAPAAAPKAPKPPAGPVFKRRIAPPLFIAIVALLVLGLIAAVAVIRSRYTPVPKVDNAAAARAQKERQLREEGNILLRQGRVTDAYAKFAELQRLNPKSPYVTTMMEKLNAMRQQEVVSKQQAAAAEAKFQEGLALYNQKKWSDAVVVFQEAFNLNPNSMQTAEYLKLAQAEDQKAQAARTARQQRRPSQTAVTDTASQTATTATTATVAAEPAEITTAFAHPFTDGRIVVRIGGDIVANEQLFIEKPARFLRRASRTPRAISVTHSFPAKNADVQIWVTIPASNVQEHHTLPAIRFEPGSSHRLTVRYEAASKKFSYELN